MQSSQSLVPVILSEFSAALRHVYLSPRRTVSTPTIRSFWGVPFENIAATPTLQQSSKACQSNLEIEKRTESVSQRECKSSFSGEQRRILPRRFSTARFRCHSLNKRLAVNCVIFAALASSSLVASNSRPPGTFCPISSARQITTPPSLLRAE